MSLLSRRSFTAVLLCSTVIGMGLTGCGGGASHSLPATSPVVSRGQYGTLTFTLSTTKSTFAVGETVPFVFTVTNTGSQPVTNYNGFGAQDMAKAAIRQGTTRVWTTGGLPPEANGGGPGNITDTIAPGESRRFEFIWSQHSNGLAGELEGPQVSPGTYQVSAYANLIIEGVTESDRETKFAAAPLDITITP